MSFLDTILNNINVGNFKNQITITLSCNMASVTLPIPPESFTLSVVQNNQTVNINNSGEFNMIGKTGLKAISLSSFFPASPYEFCVTTPDSPYTYIKTIDTWRTSGDICHITIEDTPIDIDCLIDSFSYGEKDATGDVYFTLSLKEYIKLVTADEKQKEIDKQNGLQKRPESFWSKVKKNITFRPGDNIMDIASRAVGKSITVNNETMNHLQLYRKIVKHGGLSVGDALEIGTRYIKVGNKNVLSKKN